MPRGLGSCPDRPNSSTRLCSCICQADPQHHHGNRPRLQPQLSPQLDLFHKRHARPGPNILRYNSDFTHQFLFLAPHWARCQWRQNRVNRRQKRTQWLQFPGCRQDGHREKARNGTQGHACAPLGLPTSEGRSPPRSPGRRARKKTLQPIRSSNMSGQHWSASPTTRFCKHDSWNFLPHASQTSHAEHPPLLRKAAVRGN